MQRNGISHAGKGQCEGFAEPMRAASNEGKRLRHGWDCKRKSEDTENLADQ
jgi:hypothetical protein